ncbi:3-deoxy-D-manno-octulosonic acid transferase [Ancylomarina salipaludis]|uniref:3-deoxy-D-manno-octulosonic acid transferase n=1 Tax=Ancylomarina salipaludis TaxID=2501299 RepID=A0A4Q1JKP8_9BACT|nr:glycosyltransferase N-terminal domain-containing protein [Ancylomarina salipaludis]RXQ92989.1 3-deoxy-D-manno-octulosonic acid transferase [Ancylomarina salipaludis]
MILFYNLSIFFYTLLVRFASLFNPKAKQWLDGRKSILAKIEAAVKGESNLVWFHSASLGEFEQGRPVIEAFKKKHPDYKIVLTFFSPSGYEIRKNYGDVDFVFYLPVDTKRNAKAFIRLINPKMVFFIKYEFWYHYLNELRKNEVPTYIFSTIFRPKQIFFKPYGGLYRKILNAFTHFFVQNQESIDLLKGIGFENVSLAGDTRFDRVYSIAKQATVLPQLEDFAQGRPVMIAGSTWPKDEEHIIKYINASKTDYKYIIAAHEVDENHISNIVSAIEKPYVRFTNATKAEIDAAEVLVVDCIGVLSSLYRYGDISYIGGGFGRGIHNTLEAACYGMPVIFGPNYHKFKEAKDLIALGGAHSYENYEELNSLFDFYHDDVDARKKSGASSKNYVDEMRGATDKILYTIKF